MVGSALGIILGYQYLLNQQLKEQIEDLRTDLIHSEVLNETLKANVLRINNQTREQARLYKQAVESAKALQDMLDVAKARSRKRVQQIIDADTPVDCRASMDFLINSIGEIQFSQD